MGLQCNNVLEILDFDQIICLYIRSSEPPPPLHSSGTLYTRDTFAGLPCAMVRIIIFIHPIESHLSY